MQNSAPHSWALEPKQLWTTTICCLGWLCCAVLSLVFLHLILVLATVNDISSLLLSSALIARSLRLACFTFRTEHICKGIPNTTGSLLSCQFLASNGHWCFDSALLTVMYNNATLFLFNYYLVIEDITIPILGSFPLICSGYVYSVDAFWWKIEHQKLLSWHQFQVP